MTKIEKYKFNYNSYICIELSVQKSELHLVVFFDIYVRYLHTTIFLLHFNTCAYVPLFRLAPPVAVGRTRPEFM